MPLVLAGLGALVGGAIGAAIWAAVAYYAEMEIGWIAWGVGVLAGVGAKIAARDELSPTVGIVAALVALLSVAAGKLVVIEVYLAEATADYEMTDELAISYLADDVVAEWIEEGRPVEWPEGSNPFPEAEADYPVEIWSEATTRWSALSPGDKEIYKASLQSQQESYLEEVRGEAFLQSFGILDIVFLALAVITAFRLGSGTAAVSET